VGVVFLLLLRKEGWGMLGWSRRKSRKKQAET